MIKQDDNAYKYKALIILIYIKKLHYYLCNRFLKFNTMTDYE